ncbi:MAG: molybdopterin-dependent oxidoreductase, partial [Candidatus Limnocylindria bacterium]
AVPVVLLHLLPRRWRLLRPRGGGPRLSRRTLLAGAGMAVLGAVAWGTANVLDALQGGARRFTGSRWLPDGGIPPPTTFYGEGTPSVDPTAWRLRVSGRVASPLSLDLGALARLGVEERAEVLDCTSGWAMRTGWQGTPLRAVLEAAGADSRAPHVRVRSTTGWSVNLEREELDTALLATHVADAPLPAANGAPCRLVAPDRRGLDWIKWVTDIEVG